jgi:hypothetical protein
MTNTARRCRDKADEARTLAEGMTNPVARETMLSVALSWEREAERLERKEQDKAIEESQHAQSKTRPLKKD